MFGLDFDEIISLDFEYVARPGELPEVVCLVYRELGSGKEERLWVDQLGPEPPFRVDAGVLFVGYFLSAEWSCFLQLGWPLPARSVDLFVEHRVDRNGIEVAKEKRGLLDACSFHGLLVMSKDEKGDMRDLDHARRTVVTGRAHGDPRLLRRRRRERSCPLRAPGAGDLGSLAGMGPRVPACRSDEGRRQDGAQRRPRRRAPRSRRSERTGPASART